MGGLNFSFFAGAIGFSEEGCGANVHKVPAEAEKQEGDGEMAKAGAGEVNGHAAQGEDCARGNDVEQAQFFD